MKRTKKRAARKAVRKVATTCSTCGWAGTWRLCNADVAASCIYKGPKHSYKHWRPRSTDTTHQVREGDFLGAAGKGTK